MQTILPHNSAILIAENNEELRKIFDKITTKNGNFIKEIGYISGGKGHQFYILERENIIIVRFAGIVEESTEEIISNFYVENGFCW